MANLQFGDIIKFQIQPTEISGIMDVAPVKYNALDEQWVVCEQRKATHMLIMADVGGTIKYAMIEIGKCKNIYLLADAIVD